MNQQLTVILTEKCNLSCVYCYEKNDRLITISFEKAISFLENNLNAIDEYNHVIIDFFGGEPFLEFELIKKIYEYLKNKKYRKTFQFFATTNGTLVHGQIQEWLRNHKQDFSIGLSLDGDKESHDKNRCNSFDLIDLSFFSTEYPNQGIKMTISPESVVELAKNVVYAHGKGFNVSCNLAYGVNWDNEKIRNCFSQQLDLLIDFYLKNLNIKPCSLLDGPIVYEEKPKFYKRFCGNGKSMKVLSPQGKEYGCQLLTPLSSKHNVSFLNIEDKTQLDKLPEECKKCNVLNCCPNCYSANYNNNGDMFKKDSGFCQMQKIIIRKRVFFKTRLWNINALELDPQDEKQLLKSILALRNF